MAFIQSTHETPSAIVHEVERPQASWHQTMWDQYPELRYLAEGEIQATGEGSATTASSWSEELTGEKKIELDRSLMSLRCLGWILEGEYATFVADQRGEKLSQDAFSILNRMGEQILDTSHLSQDEKWQLMETALVLGDLGKSQEFRAHFPNITVQDHDDFYGELMSQLALQERPHLLPSFSNLHYDAKQILLATAHLAHYGHITHLEGGPAMFSTLKESEVVKNGEQEAFDFDFFVHLCDVAGAAGHVNQNSSIVLNQDSFLSIMAGYNACLLLFKGKDEIAAYQSVLQQRAEWLGLDHTTDEGHVLSRIGAMLRLRTREDGETLQRGWNALSSENQALISKHFVSSTVDKEHRNPTYIPAVLVNLKGHKDYQDDPLVHAMEIGLPFIAQVLEAADPKITRQNPLNFNPIAIAAKETPEALRDGNFHIAPDGMVTLN